MSPRRRNSPVSLCLVFALAVLFSPKAVFGAGRVVAWGNPTYQAVATPEDLTNVVAISAGRMRNLALREDGTVIAWGKDVDRTNDFSAQLTNIIGISAGWDHSLALRDDGTVVAWGGEVWKTNVPPYVTNIVAVAAGQWQSIGLRADGRVVEWSSGIETVPGLEGVVAIGAGESYWIALKGDGSLAVFGSQHNIREMMPPGATNIVGISAGYRDAAAVRADGRMFRWGDEAFGYVDEIQAGAGEVALGWTTLGNLREDGFVLEWPWTYDWQTGRWTRQDWQMRAIHASVISSSSYSLALIGSGAPRFIERYTPRRAIAGHSTVFLSATPLGAYTQEIQWQRNGVDVPGATTRKFALVRPGLEMAGEWRLRARNNFGTAISEPIIVTVVPVEIVRHPKNQSITRGGTALFEVEASGVDVRVQWLFNGEEILGETKRTLSITNVEEAKLGRYSVRLSSVHGVVESAPAVLALSEVAAWGMNDYGQTDVPTDLREVVGIAAGEFFSLALLADGTVRGWGTNYFGPMLPPANETNFVSIATSFRHTLGLRKDGTVAAWGPAEYEETNVPPGLSNVVAVAAQHARSYALKEDGTVVPWGSASHDSALTSLSNVVAISTGSEHWLALKADGTLAATANGTGRTNLLPGVSNVVGIDAGSYHSVALKADGTVVMFSSHDSSADGMPQTLTNIVSVSAAWIFSAALRRDGTVVSWGWSQFGQTNVPAELDGVTAISAGGFHTLALASEGPPRIQPVVRRRSALAGTFAHLSVPAIGEWPLRYQWEKGGVQLEGETNAYFVLMDPHPTNSGNYAVRIWNDRGEVISPEFDLEIPVARFVTTLTNVATYQDGPARFELSVEGKELSYTWLFEGNVIAGETNSSLSLTNLQPANAGKYSVVVSNAYGAASAEAELGVLPALITRQPMATTNKLVRNPVTFSVSAEGVGLQYQWRLNGAELPGETNATLRIAEANWDDDGIYTVAVRSVYGEVISGEAKLNVVAAVSFSPFGSPRAVPEARTIVSFSSGFDHSLGVTADGLVVGWGPTNQAKTRPPAGLTSVVAVSAGRAHSVALTREGKVVSWGGSTSSGTAKGPELLDNVVSISAGLQRSVGLRADGSVVSWGLNREAPPAMNDVIAIADAFPGTLALKANGRVTGWPTSALRRFDTLSNIVAITASENIWYALRSDGLVFSYDGFSARALTSATNIVAMAANVFLRSNGTLGGGAVVYNLTNVVDVGTGGFPFAVMTFGGGSASPRVQPEVNDRYAVKGGTVFFAPRVVGKHPFAYEWLHKGQTLAGETNRFLQLTNVTDAAAGVYQVRVRNEAGEVTSEEMRLTVREPEEPNVAIEKQTASRVWIRAAGPVGSVLSLETSPDLGGFLNQRRLTNVTGTVFVEDATTATNGFYRLKTE